MKTDRAKFRVDIYNNNDIPDRPFRRIIVNYGNLKSRMVGLWFWYNNFYSLPS